MSLDWKEKKVKWFHLRKKRTQTKTLLRIFLLLPFFSSSHVKHLIFSTQDIGLVKPLSCDALIHRDLDRFGRCSAPGNCSQGYSLLSFSDSVKHVLTGCLSVLLCVWHSGEVQLTNLSFVFSHKIQLYFPVLIAKPRVLTAFAILKPGYSPGSTKHVLCCKELAQISRITFHTSFLSSPGGSFCPRWLEQGVCLIYRTPCTSALSEVNTPYLILKACGYCIS